MISSSSPAVLRGVTWTPWFALFSLLAVAQTAHLLEHAAQMVQIHLLGLWGADARGIVGQLDVEWVHFLWNAWVVLALAVLLFRYRSNRWLVVAAAIAAWHLVEHDVILRSFLAAGIAGTPGLLARGGLVGGGLPLSRPDLHFLYNFVETAPILVAYAVEVRSSRLGPRFDAARRPDPDASLRFTARRRRASFSPLLAAAGSLVLGVAVVLPYAFPTTLRVPEDYATIQAAVDAALPGSTIQVGPGTFRETVRIAKPLTLLGAPDGATRIEGDRSARIVTVEGTHGVTLARLTVVGGELGILVEESQSVRIRDNRVLGADFAGIRLSRASAAIVGNEVREVSGPYGMGIELANTVSRPPSLIRDNVVADCAREGIVLHNAHALIEENRVMRNGLHGIAVTEMSMATVRGNVVQDSVEAGIYVVDHSMTEVSGNRISRVRVGPLGVANGIRAYFYAEVTLGPNVIELDPQEAIVAKLGASVIRSVP